METAPSEVHEYNPIHYCHTNIHDPQAQGLNYVIVTLNLNMQFSKNTAETYIFNRTLLFFTTLHLQ